MTKLIFGCGYLGERVASRWQAAGHAVAIVTRSADRAADFRRRGRIAIVADVTQPQTRSELPAADTILFAVGFDRASSRSIHEVYVSGLQNALAALPARSQRFVHISTTGVYGDAHGAWIDELTPPAPTRDGGRATLAAEKLLAAHPLGKNAVILRLAGLYGPGRVPFLDKLRAGQPIPAAGDGHLNLIHVDDAANVVVAADALAPFTNGPCIYCVSDGQPVRREIYYREIAHQVGAPPPTFVEPGPASPRAIRSESDRRIRNTKLVTELRPSLMYTNYRAGLAAILTNM